MVFQNLAKIEMMQNKNWLFGCHFEMEQHFEFFFRIVFFSIARTYVVQISFQNSGGKVVFSGPPLAPTGVKVPWSLKCLKRTFVATCLIYEHMCSDHILKNLKFLQLTAHNCQKWKRVFLTCPCHEIYRVEAVGLKSSNNALKIVIFAKKWNFGAISLKLLFCQ